MTLNKLVKLTMLWTTGPCTFLLQKYLILLYVISAQCDHKHPSHGQLYRNVDIYYEKGKKSTETFFVKIKR